mgnify:CR=1 FL=1
MATDGGDDGGNGSEGEQIWRRGCANPGKKMMMAAADGSGDEERGTGERRGQRR